MPPFINYTLLLSVQHLWHVQLQTTTTTTPVTCITYRGFITSCKEELSVKRHLAVTNVSNHWYLFTQWSMIKDLMAF